MRKVWEYVSVFLVGVIGGIFFFVKFLDNPETQVNIKKIKNKDIVNSDLQQNLDVKVENKTEKKRVRNIFRKNKL